MASSPETGNHSMVNVTRGMLKEYSKGANALQIYFEFNPSTITRSRSIEIKFKGKGTAKDFKNESEATRASQGATVKAESFTLKILLDATDRMNSDDKDAMTKGVQPELDILCSMVEPKRISPGGMATLAALSDSDNTQSYPSVLIFHWGKQTLPVFITRVQFEVKAFMPTLVPYRAEATLTLQVIQSVNEYYTEEIKRMFSSAQSAKGLVQGFQDSGKK